jgi:putative acetyltransferase
MRPEEARTFLEIHHAAVRGLAVNDYSASVIENWAPIPITEAAVDRFLMNQRDGEIRLMAEMEGGPVGIGVLVVTNSELRACYVDPRNVRKGVGSALIWEIERLARQHGLTQLHLDSSLNAEPFYAALGYCVEERIDYTLSSGVKMAAVKMRRRLE